MATELEPEEHLAGLAVAMRFGVAAAGDAGLDAPVPTCPDWTVRQLIAHTGMVHRWAEAQLRGAAAEVGDGSQAEQEGLGAVDALAWWQAGAQVLHDTIAAAADDVVAPVFLHDAPAPRRFWARRQCHETTIHAVDAVAAALGRRPGAAEVTAGDGPAISDRLALDGIDELVMGFLPRRKSSLRSDRPQRLWIHPRDADRSWLLDVGPEPPVATPIAAGLGADADIELTGTPQGMYLSLWNRADELDGDTAAIEQWAELAAVRWG